MPNERNKTRSIIFTVVIIVAAIALLVYLKPKSKTQAAPPPSQANAAPLSVSMVIVKSESLENQFYTNGNIMANEALVVKNEAAGRVVQIFFSEGKPVNKGQELVKLNDSDLKAQLNKLQSSEKTSSADADRLRQLLQANGVSQSEYDNALNTVNGIKADIENIQAQIEKTEIKAPFDGIIGLRNISVGSYLAPGTTITTLQQINPIKIDFTIPGKYASQIPKDAAISFTVDGLPGKFDAKTYASEPTVDATTGTIELRAICPNPDGKLLPGMFAHISVTLQTDNNAIMLPSQAILAKQNAESVYLVKQGKAVSQAVTIGLRTDSTVQVLSGLSIGDSVITSAILAVKPGAAVKYLSTTAK